MSVGVALLKSRLEGHVYVPEDRKERLRGRKLIVFLENAHIKCGFGKSRKHELLNSKKHKNLLQKLDVPIEEFRPDILYQALVHLTESELNRWGYLLIYIRTSDRELIEVNPQMEMPKCYSDFESLMITLLLARKVRAKGANVTLMRFVKNDIETLLPPGVAKYGLTSQGDLVDIFAFAQSWDREDRRKVLGESNNNRDELRVTAESMFMSIRDRDKAMIEQGNPIALFIGAVAKSNPTSAQVLPFLEKELSISEDHMTAARVCSDVCAAFEEVWCRNKKKYLIASSPY